MFSLFRLLWYICSFISLINTKKIPEGCDPVDSCSGQCRSRTEEKRIRSQSGGALPGGGARGVRARGVRQDLFCHPARAEDRHCAEGLRAHLQWDRWEDLRFLRFIAVLLTGIINYKGVISKLMYSTVPDIKYNFKIIFHKHLMLPIAIKKTNNHSPQNHQRTVLILQKNQCWIWNKDWIKVNLL